MMGLLDPRLMAYLQQRGVTPEMLAQRMQQGMPQGMPAQPRPPVPQMPRPMQTGLAGQMPPQMQTGLAGQIPRPMPQMQTGLTGQMPPQMRPPMPRPGMPPFGLMPQRPMMPQTNLGMGNPALQMMPRGMMRR